MTRCNMMLIAILLFAVTYQSIVSSSAEQVTVDLPENVSKRIPERDLITTVSTDQIDGVEDSDSSNENDSDSSREKGLKVSMRDIVITSFKEIRSLASDIKMLSESMKAMNSSIESKFIDTESALMSLQKKTEKNELILQYSEDLALKTPAMQSSQFLHFDASRANDGNQDQNLLRFESCSHTNNPSDGSRSWWAVDLGDNYCIWRVRILGRNEDAVGRFKDLNIGISNNNPSKVKPSIDNYDLCGYTGSSYTGNIYDIICKRPTSGRYVIVQYWKANNYLTICDAKVYGYKSNDKISC